MMTIGLIEKLSQDDSSITTYFFCQNADYKLNTIEAIIKGLIWQLVQQRAELIGSLQRRWDAVRSCWKESMSWRTLWDIFLEMLNRCSHQRVADQELLTTAEQVGIGLELNSDHLEVAIQTYVSHKIASELLNRAEGTFLWVSLVCKRLQSGEDADRVLPDEALSIIQDLPPGLHSLYERIYGQIINGHFAIVEGCLRLLRVKMLVYRPLERAEVASVTGISETKVTSEKIVDRCASFLRMRGSVIEFVHRSPRDFLAGSSSFSFHEQYGHGEIALSCLSYMSKVLKPNLIKLPRPDSTREENLQEVGHLNDDITVLHSLNYAATPWVDHLESARNEKVGKSALDGQGPIVTFLRVNLLEWLECLSLLGQLRYAIKALNILESIAESSLLQAIVFDATRFLLRHYQTISTWPLQIYSSAIVFSPESSLVRADHNIKKIPMWFKRIPHLENTWETLIQTLEGHSDWVNVVAFSPDGKRIASASDDETIRLWDASTGDHLQTLQGHSGWVSAIAFSPDGKQIASASNDLTIKLWDVSHFVRSKRLMGNSLSAIRKFHKWYHQIQTSAPVRALKFSSDGQFLQTNIGLIQITNSDFKAKATALYLENGWICYRSRPVFRTRAGLQPSCYNVQGNYIAIGCRNGSVLCLEIDCRILDKLFVLH